VPGSYVSSAVNIQRSLATGTVAQYNELALLLLRVELDLVQMREYGRVRTVFALPKGAGPVDDDDDDALDDPKQLGMIN